MKKDFLDELVDGLLELKENKKVSISVPPAPHEVIKVLLKVANNHNITQKELGAMLAFRDDLSKDEIAMLKDIGDNK